jgi:signal transduction histidine kinase
MKTHEQFQAGDVPGVLATSPRAVGAADYEERLHAVRSSLAGMSGALQVLTEHRDELPEASSRRIETLLVEEVERLRRLVAPPAHDAMAMASEDLDLDSLVAKVVLGRRMAGQEVAWSPSGCQVRVIADDVVEALNVLLVNAWRHALGALARIDVMAAGSTILVTVSDDGPGILPALRDSIFERGVSRPGSPGQGLGLAMARSLVERSGGELALLPASHGGATFCLTLPAAVQEEAA